MTTPPRLVPDRPLPPEPYIPGRNQRPELPAAPASPPLTQENWPACHSYLFGFDLFNHGYCWEAHEVWEGLWRGCGRQGAVADFLKGLIKLAAAGVKRAQAQPAGVQSHARRARELFDNLAQSGIEQLLGFRPAELARLADHLASDTDASSPTLVPAS
jgi:hypothetical protein